MKSKLNHEEVFARAERPEVCSASGDSPETEDDKKKHSNVFGANMEIKVLLACRFLPIAR